MENVDEKLENGALTFSKDSVIVTNDAVYDIQLLGDLNDDMEFNDETAYIDNNIFYIFRGIPKKTTTEYMKPGIYQNKEGSPKYYLVEPQSDEDKQAYSVSDHVASLVPTSIIDTANTKEELLIAIPESTKVFQPTLLDTDDILKRVIKTTLQNMKINLKSLKHKFNNDYDLNNLKSQLLKPGAMSSKYFQKWAEVLDIDVEVIVRDKPGFEKLRDEITIILK